MTPPPSREAAWELLTEYTKGESLLKHALAVEAAVRGYARTFGEDEEGWGVVALLHDFDYERWPSLDEHPYRGSEILRDLQILVQNFQAIHSSNRRGYGKTHGVTQGFFGRQHSLSDRLTPST